MKGTVPIITCDDEYGCDEWELDHFEMGVMNWRELMQGWKYDPYNSGDDMFCPEHAKGATDE